VPYHLCWHLADGINSLRGKKLFRQIRESLRRCHEKEGFRIVHWSVQSNHLHAIGEADDVRFLSRGMQGLGVSLAKRINKVSGRQGAVFDDRFFARALSTPRQVATARDYVLRNSEVHEKRLGHDVSRPGFDAFSSVECAVYWPGLSAEPQTWLLAVGWRKALRTRPSG